MQRLKIVLQSKWFYLFLLVFISIDILIVTKVIRYSSKYQDGNVKIVGKVLKYTKKEDKITLTVKAKEKIIVSYYKKLDIAINDYIEIVGEVKTPSQNTIPNTFNYQKYLYNNKIYKTLTAKEIKVIKDNKNIFASIKDWVIKRSYHHEYLLLFICGDKTGMESSIYENFKDCGIAHLLAISGMHVSVFIMILQKLLFFLNKNKRNIFIIVFLLFYSYIVGFTPSILRVVIFFIIGTICKRWNINIKPLQKLMLTAFIILLINPFNIYATSFQYSFITAYSIILVQNKLKKNYFVNTLLISYWTLLFTLPITASLNYEINLMTFICNLVFIPYVSFWLYPLALLTFIFPFLSGIFSFFTGLMDKVIGIFNEVNFLFINIPKMSFIIIIIFYIILLLYIYLHKKRYIVLLIILICLVKVYPKLDNNMHVIYFDVGQGDSSAIISKHQKDVILIDTGGLRNYQVSNNVILYLKSLGITKLDTLILTHGDFDHMGDAINIVNNLKVKKVIFNKGEFNDLEKNLIKVLKKKKIKYYEALDKLKIGNNELLFLNTKMYDNENDNSNVIYMDINGYKFMFMGDAGIDKEKDILDKYNLPEIDFLKVGHHGSDTSSEKNFINRIKPKYSLISVGKNNRYGHPKDSVLDILSSSKIYRTDLNGSIEIILSKSKFKLQSYPP